MTDQIIAVFFIAARDDFVAISYFRSLSNLAKVDETTFASSDVGKVGFDLPPSEWSKIDDILDCEGDYECRAKSIARKRLSASCVKRRLFWRRVPRPQRRVGGSRSASRSKEEPIGPAVENQKIAIKTSSPTMTEAAAEMTAEYLQRDQVSRHYRSQELTLDASLDHLLSAPNGWYF